MRAVITEMANEMANKRIKEVLPELMKETLESMAKMSSDKKTVAESNSIDSVE